MFRSILFRKVYLSVAALLLASLIVRLLIANGSHYSEQLGVVSNYLIVGAALGIIFSLIDTFLLARQLNNQLGQMIESVQAISQGEYQHRLSIKRKDKIGALAVAINAMAERIETNFLELVGAKSALEKAQDGLEKRVVERTETLIDTNALLFEQIIERKQAEELWRESEDRYRELFENAKDIVYTIDLDGNFTSLNKAGERATGYTQGEALQLSFEQVVAPEYLEMAREQMKKKTAGGGPTVYEIEVIAKDGQRIPFETSTRLIEQNGKPIGIQGISRDITERRRLEEQLRQSQKLESVGQLAAGIAHEINTPLQYVGDNTRFLQDAYRDLNTALKKHNELLQICRTGRVEPEIISEVEESLEASDLEYLMEEVPVALQQSLEGIERVTQIVQSIKDFAYPGSTEMKAANLNKSIESTITVARNEWKYVANLETDFDKNLSPVTCMISEVNQVVLNLIINAAHTIADVVGDGSKGKGLIKIKTCRNGEFAEIRISDTGKGIPEEIRDKIFNPFFTTKDVGRGTGQGLAISHRVVCKHGGSLTFETQLGSGTTFIVSLPINGSEAATPAAVVQTLAA